MNLKQWRIPIPGGSAPEELAAALGCGLPLAGVLVSRGLGNPRDAAEFLSCSFPPEDPGAMADMEKAAGRIKLAVERGERIEIFGDYDVDGITATALLFEYLESIGADVYCSLPVRDGEGYGLYTSMIDRMKADGVSLVVTVDNGISAAEAVAYAGRSGIDLVVTDHHKVPDTLPEAAAVVDPLRPDDGSAFKELAGVGVALKLAAAIEGCPVQDMLEPFGALAALGTISDVMPLLSENRYIVKRGLEALRQSDNPGLLALASACGIDLNEVCARTVAFTLAPKLNAAGRMKNADLALELLLTDDPQRAAELASELMELNSLRQQSEREMMELIEAEMAARPELRDQPALVFWGENYSTGVSGIVCSRLAEKHGRPAIIISVNGSVAKGSGRGVEGSSLYEAVCSAGDLLTRYGGHDMAAGFTMPVENIPEFSRRINEYYRRRATEVHVVEFPVDSLAEFSDFREKDVLELSRLAPFGAGNPEPVFATLGARVESVVPLNERHSRITLSKNGASITGAMFSKSPSSLPFRAGDLVDAAYCVSIYSSPRGRMVSYRLLAVRPAGLPEQTVLSLARYLAMKAGGEKPPIRLTREKVAEVYREVKRRGQVLDTAESYAFLFGSGDLGESAAAVDVLRELELIKCVQREGQRYVQPVANPAKKELGSSEIFKRFS